MALIDIQVPDIGDFDEVSVIELLVKPGDTVTVNQVIVEIETAKSLVELPCPFAGVISELMAAEGHYYKLYQAQARNVDTEPELQRSAEPVSKELSK